VIAPGEQRILAILAGYGNRVLVACCDQPHVPQSDNSGRPGTKLNRSVTQLAAAVIAPGEQLAVLAQVK